MRLSSFLNLLTEDSVVVLFSTDGKFLFTDCASSLFIRLEASVLNYTVSHVRFSLSLGCFKVFVLPVYETYLPVVFRDIFLAFYPFSSFSLFDTFSSEHVKTTDVSSNYYRFVSHIFYNFDEDLLEVVLS